MSKVKKMLLYCDECQKDEFVPVEVRNNGNTEMLALLCEEHGIDKDRKPQYHAPRGQGNRWA